MVGYRRNRIAGATYFFTVTLRDRRSPLLVEDIATVGVDGCRLIGRVMDERTTPAYLESDPGLRCAASGLRLLHLNRARRGDGRRPVPHTRE